MSQFPLFSASAFLLVYHGSRDPRPQKVCRHLADYLEQYLTTSLSQSEDNYSFLGKKTKSYSGLIHPQSQTLSSLVETVPLELAELPLHQNIVQFAEKACNMGKKNLVIIPLFLSLGVHVTRDIPSEIALAQTQLQKSITIFLSPPLGSYWELESLLLEQFQQFSTPARILLAHGSRLAKANHQTEYLAARCNAEVAYWSIEPHWETAIKQQMANNPQEIAIMPYFLFPGRITDAIAQKVVQLQREFPQTNLIMGQPLGASQTLAKLIFHSITA